MNGVGEEWWLEGQSQGLEVALEPEVYFGDYSYVQVIPARYSQGSLGKASKLYFVNSGT